MQAADWSSVFEYVLYMYKILLQMESPVHKTNALHWLVLSQWPIEKQAHENI